MRNKKILSILIAVFCVVNLMAGFAVHAEIGELRYVSADGAFDRTDAEYNNNTVPSIANGWTYSGGEALTWVFGVGGKAANDRSAKLVGAGTSLNFQKTLQGTGEGRNTVPETGYQVLEFNVYSEDIKIEKRLEIKSGSNWWNQGGKNTFRILGNSGTFVFNATDVPTDTVKFEAGKWYTVTMIFQEGSTQYSAYVNGIPVGTFTGHASGGYAGIDTLKFMLPGNGTANSMVLDDIKVYDLTGETDGDATVSASSYTLAAETISDIPHLTTVEALKQGVTTSKEAASISVESKSGIQLEDDDYVETGMNMTVTAPNGATKRRFALNVQPESGENNSDAKANVNDVLAGNAIDDDMLTCWVGNWDREEETWISVDAEEPAEYNSIVVTGKNIPDGVKLMCSDDDTDYQEITILGMEREESENKMTLSFETIEARYYKLVMPSSVRAPKIYDIDFVYTDYTPDVNVEGKLISGLKVKGVYQFFDFDETAEGNSCTYRWLVCEDESEQPISGADGIEYVLTENEVGKKIKFEITPVKEDVPGKSYTSDAYGPVQQNPTIADAAAINIGVPESDYEKITKDLVLLTTGAAGSTISWESNNPNVIATDGAVMRTGQNEPVTLTATVSFEDGPVVKKRFDLVVLKKEVANNNTGGSFSGGGSGRNPGRTKGEDYAVPLYQLQQPDMTPFQNQQNPKEFADLDSVPWAKDVIGQLYQKGIINGTSETEFSPEKNITRAEFTKIIVTLFDLELHKGTSVFADVADNAWYADYIYTAVQNGIINGYSDGQFGVNDNITREQAATILYRALTNKGHSLKAGGAAFSDGDNIADYAAESVTALAENEILTGNPDGTFNPKGNTTRAETAVMVYRVYTKYCE